jgi:tRNA(Arg) A34 adenosine deaminase TadA
MRNKIWNYFEMAGKLACEKRDGRSFLLGSVGVRGDGAIVSAVNAISQEPNRLLHSEYKLSRRLDYGATVYVVRIRLLNGEYAISRPCFSCEKVLKSRRVKRIYYTISNNEYGVIDF